MEIGEQHPRVFLSSVGMAVHLQQGEEGGNIQGAFIVSLSLLAKRRRVTRQEMERNVARGNAAREEEKNSEWRRMCDERYN